ncbi:MAG: outer membrane protein transport protein [Burkholderiaceae bacterium]
MTPFPKLRLSAIAAACAIAAPAAFATNGYFPHGYGMKAKGMGGASVALAEDSMVGANNPAAMVWSGARMDVGLDIFMPKRNAERSGAAVPSLNGKVESDKTSFAIPEFGYVQPLGSTMAAGVTLYGNGGMNTTYPQGNFNCGGGAANMLCGSGTLGVDLSQLIVAPTVSVKLAERHAFGVALLLGYQRFKITGAQAFAGMSSSPADVSNNGYDSSTGVGLRLGYQGRLTDQISVGAAYAPKMNMGKLDKYRGLFAGSGDFDIPEHYNIGVAFTPMPALTIAFDAGRINYSGVGAVGNPSSNQAPLGSAGGPGFGWKNIDVYKLGVIWRLNDAWTVRAGYNRGDNPVTAGDVSFNILAPGVMKDHYTAGFTFGWDKSNEITGYAMVAPRQTVTGPSMFNSPALIPPGGQGGNETIGMKQTSFGVSWARKF